MAFDSKTGTLWAADVGPELWEEINIIKAGGNYGWNVREAKHWFRPDGADVNRTDLIDPIGNTITTSGSRLPAGRSIVVLAFRNSSACMFMLIM